MPATPPTSATSTTPDAPAAQAQPAAPPLAQGKVPGERAVSRKDTRHTKTPPPPLPPEAAYAQGATTPPVCTECATIESVRELKREGAGTGLGAVGGGILGGLLGNQIGSGRGQTVGAVVGAVGGAYAGNEVEKNVRSTTRYQITARFDDGTVPPLQRSDSAPLPPGRPGPAEQRATHPLAIGGPQLTRSA